MKKFRDTFSVAFYCRDTKTNKQGLAPIELAVNIQGQRVFVNLSRKARPAIFRKECGDYLREIENKIYEWQTRMMQENLVITKDALLEYIRSGFQFQGKSIQKMLDEFYDTLQKRLISGRLSPSVIRKYHLVIDTFFDPLDKAQNPNIITRKMVSDYVTEIVGKYKTSTSAGMLTKFKSLWLFARDNGYVDINLFSGIKINKKADDVIPLTEMELERIENKTFDCERLERVKDMFLFACYTAISFCDLQALKPTDFMEHNGQVYIEKERAKTGVKFCVVLLPPALAIAKKYGYQFPRISNAKMNSYLKEIGDFCGIKKNLHFHLGRHTAACIYLNKYHFSVELTAQILGHQNIRTTQHYAQMWSTTLFDAFATISAPVSQ